MSIRVFINLNSNSALQRLKILIGTFILIITLFALTISLTGRVSISESENTISTERSKIALADQRISQLYAAQQQELKVAINTYFEKAIASGDIVGAGVSIVKGDSIVVSEGYGTRNVNKNDGVDGQTIFRLGSLSKGFAGILAAKLVEEGQLKWEDKVSDFIAGFQLGDSGNTDQITLANLLSHTAGAPYHSYTNLVEAGLSLTDIAERFKEVAPIGKPGSIYSYQNALFALSGEMIYKATGQEFNTLLENSFFKPLEMCSATIDHETLTHAENVAIPHSKRRNQWMPIPITNNYYNAVAAGGISASALDMAKWMRFILGHNPEIMNTSSLEKAFRPVIEIKGHHKYYQRWPGHLSSYYGYGWRIDTFEDLTDREKTIWHHGGSVNHYRNEIAVYPETDLGICVLLNNNSKLAKTVVPDLYKIVQEVYERTTGKIALNGNANALPNL
jgi:beta-lactamase class C